MITSHEVSVCPVCGSDQTELFCQTKDLEYLTSDTEYTYNECRNCTTVYIDKFPLSKLKEIYPANYYSFLGQKRNLALTIKEFLDKLTFQSLLKSFQNRRINVLDVGGGSGWLLDIIRSIHKNIHVSQVVDIDANAKELAESNGHAFFQGPIEEFETKTQFDFVLMLNLIEHISNPVETLNKIERLLSPDGKILIKTPNVDSWDARLFRSTYWGGLHCPRHWILFSQKSFRMMVDQTPLKVHSIRYTQGAPFWAWSTLISGKRKGIFAITRNRPVMFHPLIPLLHVFFAAVDFLRGALGFKTSQMIIELRKR